MAREMKNNASREQSHAGMNSAEAQPIFEHKLKDSDVKWIGEIPDDWEMSKLKYHLSISSGDAFVTEYTADDDGYPLYGGGEQMGYSTKTNGKKGSLIVGRVGSCGSVNCPETDFWATDNALIINPTLPLRFTYFLLIAANLKSLSTSNAQPLITASKIKNVSIPLPCKEEQKAIADFLDKKCAEIDGLLADLEAEVKTLAEYKKSIIAETVTRGLDPNAPMKNVPLGWIDLIPKHWEIARIASVYSVRNEKVSDKDYPPLSVTMKGIVPQLESAAKTKHGDDRKLIRKGDFVINSRSDRRGSCGISDYDGSCSLINTVLAPREEMNPRYYNWLFHTSSFADEFYKWGYGIVDDLWTTNWGAMRRIQIPVPPLDEQEAIASYLDNKILQIDETIADKQTQIETLKAYKSSLIYEYVTGKKQVI